MALEQLNAAVGILTLFVVALASTAALIQLRHLRGANTLNTLLEIMRQWRDPQLQSDLRFARVELPQLLNDPAFVQSLRGRPVDRLVHRELFIADWYEQLGSYLKHGLLDETIFMDASCGPVTGAWEAIWPVVALLRESGGSSLYENFEYLAVRARAFIDRHPDGMWPRGVPRMPASGR